MLRVSRRRSISCCRIRHLARVRPYVRLLLYAVAGADGRAGSSLTASSAGQRNATMERCIIMAGERNTLLTIHRLTRPASIHSRTAIFSIARVRTRPADRVTIWSERPRLRARRCSRPPCSSATFDAIGCHRPGIHARRPSALSLASLSTRWRMACRWAPPLPLPRTAAAASTLSSFSPSSFTKRQQPSASRASSCKPKRPDPMSDASSSSLPPPRRSEASSPSPSFGYLRQTAVTSTISPAWP